VKPGETLRKIARAIRPEGVSLEQTLVGLYRQNPDAFINKNMNLVKSGKILRVPDANEIAALAPTEASQEVRMQVADFNAYRNRVADRPATAPEEGSVRSGRIGSSRVTERGAAEGPRDTVRISRGEPPGKGKPAGRMNTEERLRALEEEVIAREKALAEANERIAQLEQIIKDTQRAMELKSAGAGSAQKGAEKSGAPGQPGSSTVAVAPPVAPAAKPQEQPTPPAKAAPAEQPPSASGAEAQKQPTPAEPAPAAKPPPAQKAKAAPAPEPAKEPSFMSTLLDEPLYLAAGGAAVLLGGLAFMIVRRRRQAEHDAEDPDDTPHIAPTLGGSGGGAAQETWPGRSTLERAATRGDTATTPAPTAKVATTPTSPPAVLPAASPRATTSEDNDLDFDLEVRRAGAAGYATEPRGTAQPDVVAGNGPPTVERDSQPNEFKLDPLPPVDAPMEMEKVSSEPPPGVDFKLDLNDLDVNAPSRQAGASGHDDHWHDVQQKFDLAKSYQQMGDKGGARDILQEVLREGDKDQQAQAKKLLESLS
jgi:FimV-like protein